MFPILFSEIYDYMKNKTQRSGTAGKYEAKRYFASLEEKGINIHDMIDDTMMYTYIDRDHYGLTNVRYICIIYQ